MASVEDVLVAIIFMVQLTTGTLMGPDLMLGPHVRPPIHPLAAMVMPPQHIHLKLKPPILVHKSMYTPMNKIFKPLIFKKVKYLKYKPMIVQPLRQPPVFNALPSPRPPPPHRFQLRNRNPPPSRTNYRIQQRQIPTIPMSMFRGNERTGNRQLRRSSRLDLPTRQFVQPAGVLTRHQPQIQPLLNAFSPRSNPRWYDDDDDDDDNDDDNDDDDDDNDDDDNEDEDYDNDIDDNDYGDDDIYDGHYDYWQDRIDDLHDMEDIFDRRFARRNRNGYHNFNDRFDGDYVDDFEMSENSNNWNRNSEYQTGDTITKGGGRLVGDDVLASTSSDKSNSNLIKNVANNDRMTDYIQPKITDGNANVINKDQVDNRRDSLDVSSPSMSDFADRRSEHYDNLADRRDNNLDHLAKQRSINSDNLESRKSKHLDALTNRRSRNLDINNDRRDSYLDRIDSRRDFLDNMDYRYDNNFNTIDARRLKYSSDRFDVNNQNRRRGRYIDRLYNRSDRHSNNIYNRRKNFSNDRGDTTDSSR